MPAQPPAAARAVSFRSTSFRAPESFPAAPLVIAAYAVVWLAVLRLPFSVWRRLDRVERETAGDRRTRSAGRPAVNFAEMTSAHFIFIPAVLLIGMVIGWILGSRAAATPMRRS